MNYQIIPIPKRECSSWLLEKHYARRMPPISHSFGLFDTELQGVCTIGKPASPPLCIGVCGESESEYVFELNRLCVVENLEPNALSFFVGGVLSQLPPLIIVSYADTKWNHHGYIYQATNWIYTGMSAQRTEWRELGENSHSKSVCDMYEIPFMREHPERFQLVKRSQKHRYVYFTGTKRHKKRWRKLLNYAEQPYPKGDNKRYDAPEVAETQGVMFL